ncbi:MAG: substrate-binding domain-containing protein [Calditrichaeota bacterium]|nr:substrate-binding domain-containing protein [Calditrichota bacterium]
MMNLLRVMLCAVVIVGCAKKEPEESFTKGSAAIGVSDAVYDLAFYTAQAYCDVHPQADVTVWRRTTLSLLDSLLNNRTEEVFIDRALSSEESLLFTSNAMNLYTYPVAHYPTYLLVADSNKAEFIDSLSLKRILEGSARSWKEFGGDDITITPYAPLPGDGAWTSLLNYYGDFDSLAAVVCSTGTQMLELSRDDPGALLIFSKKVAEAAGFKKLRWAKGDLRIPANAKTIMDTPKWPFMTTYTYVTTHMKSDVAAGYLTFIVSNDGQKMVMKEGYRPASVPVRVIQLKSPPEDEADAEQDTIS